MGKQELNRVRRAAAKYQEAREALEDAIRAAAATDTARAISEATGTKEMRGKTVPVLSYTQVHELAREEFAAKQKRAPRRG